MSAFITLVALCLFGGAWANSATASQCPVVETVQDFDVSRYFGRWYEAQRLSTPYQTGTTCVVADYSRTDSDKIAMVNSYKDASGVRKQSSSVSRIANASEPGKLKIRYPSMPVGLEGDYYVLGTDYDSYAVVYSCRTGKRGSMKLAWILTRDANPSSEVLAKAQAVAEKNHIDKSLLLTTVHTNCA